MKKIAVVTVLGMALAFAPMAHTPFSPQPAYAAEMRSASPSAVSWILDLLIVRPGSYIFLAAALISYPVAWLLDPIFGDDPARLKKNWIDAPYGYAIDRPMGNFSWRSK